VRGQARRATTRLPGPQDPIAQRALDHAKVTSDLRDRLPGLFDDPNSSLTELPVVLHPLLWHIDPHCRCLDDPGGNLRPDSTSCFGLSDSTRCRGCGQCVGVYPVRVITALWLALFVIVGAVTPVSGVGGLAGLGVAGVVVANTAGKVVASLKAATPGLPAGVATVTDTIRHTGIHRMITITITVLTLAATPTAAHAAGQHSDAEGGTPSATSQIHATAEHPIHITTNTGEGRWVNAADLHPGQHLTSSDPNHTITVTRIDTYPQNLTAYNLTTTPQHTYYINPTRAPPTTNVLVHNATACPLNPSGAAAKTVPGGGQTSLYRAVDAAEFDSIADTSKWATGQGQMEGKWFATTGEDAAAWGDKLYGPGNSITMETRIPSSLADEMYYRAGKLDGVGPGRYAQDLDQLEQINQQMDGIRIWR
jgi:hypothetical protein